MCAPILKYNIKNRLWKMPDTYRKNLYNLCIHVDKSLKTVNRWIDVKKGDKFSIPSDELYMIADFLQCTPTDLING